MTQSIRRRSFLKSSIAVPCALALIPEGLVSAYRANDKLNIALVGVGGRGSWFVQAIPQVGENVIAMCDVNKDRAKESFAKMPDVPKYTDYRKMMDALGDSLDAVVVAVPDHNHAPISLEAMRRGKHVYCEKPLANNIREARIMSNAATKYSVATQMGNQGTATHAFREQVEIVRSGMLGDITEVIVWNAGGDGYRRFETRTGETVPDYLDWDLWQGPAPEREYSRQWMQWHSWRCYGTGQLGNWAIHSSNMAFMAFHVMDLWDMKDAKPEDRCIKATAAMSSIEHETFPKWSTVDFEIPRRGDLPPMKIQWLNGIANPEFRDRIERHLGRPLKAGGSDPWIEHAGCLVVGTKGMLHSTEHNSSYTLLPKDKFENVELPEQTLPRSGSHEREWTASCKGGPKAMSHFGHGGRLTEFVMLGNLADQFERPVAYDPVDMKIIGDEQANEKIGRTYRKGWEIEMIG